MTTVPDGASIACSTFGAKATPGVRHQSRLLVRTRSRPESANEIDAVKWRCGSLTRPSPANSAPDGKKKRRPLGSGASASRIASPQHRRAHRPEQASAPFIDEQALATVADQPVLVEQSRVTQADAVRESVRAAVESD